MRLFLALLLPAATCAQPKPGECTQAYKAWVAAQAGNSTDKRFLAARECDRVCKAVGGAQPERLMKECKGDPTMLCHSAWLSWTSPSSDEAWTERCMKRCEPYQTGALLEHWISCDQAQTCMQSSSAWRLDKESLINAKSCEDECTTAQASNATYADRAQVCRAARQCLEAWQAWRSRKNDSALARTCQSVCRSVPDFGAARAAECRLPAPPPPQPRPDPTKSLARPPKHQLSFSPRLAAAGGAIEDGAQDAIPSKVDVRMLGLSGLYYHRPSGILVESKLALAWLSEAGGDYQDAALSGLVLDGGVFLSPDDVFRATLSVGILKSTTKRLTRAKSCDYAECGPRKGGRLLRTYRAAFTLSPWTQNEMWVANADGLRARAQFGIRPHQRISIDGRAGGGYLWADGSIIPISMGIQPTGYFGPLEIGLDAGVDALIGNAWKESHEAGLRLRLAGVASWRPAPDHALGLTVLLANSWADGHSLGLSYVFNLPDTGPNR